MNKILIAILIILGASLLGLVLVVVTLQNNAATIASWTATPSITPNLAMTQRSQLQYTLPPTWTVAPTATPLPTATRRPSSTPFQTATLDAAVKTSIAKSAQLLQQQMGDPVDGMQFIDINCERNATLALVKITGTIRNTSTVIAGQVMIRGILYDKTGKQVNTVVGRTVADRVDPGASVAYLVQVNDPNNQFAMCKVDFEKVPLQQTFTPTPMPKATQTATPATAITITPTG